MKSTILEVIDLVAHIEGRIALAICAIGTASTAVAGGSACMNSQTKSADNAITIQVIKPAVQKTVLNPDKPSEIKFSDDYLNFIKYVENNTRSGWSKKNRVWYPYASAEGGRKTIAYGHKLKNKAEEISFAKGINEEQAIDLLIKDLEQAWNKSADYVRSKHMVNFQDLSKKQQEILTDYAFNVGNLGRFPKFTKAVIEEDWDTARIEYKRTYRRHGGKIRTLARNKIFYDRYLKP
jgi:GH24 family phage-related lysozyme (muramidase)